MEKKLYITPHTDTFELKIESLLVNESMDMNSEKNVTSDDAVFSRSSRGIWDTEE